MKLKKQLCIMAIFMTVLGLPACGSKSNSSEKNTNNLENEEKEEIKMIIPSSESDYKAEDINKISVYFLGEEIYTEDRETINMIYEEIFASDINMTKLDNYENIKEGSYNFKFYNNEDVVMNVVCLEDNVIGINSVWYNTDKDNDWNDICEQLIKGASNVDLLSENHIDGIDRLAISINDKTEDYTDAEEIKGILNLLIMEKPAYTTTHDTEYYSGKIHELKAYEKEDLVYTIKVYSEDNGSMVSVNDVMANGQHIQLLQRDNGNMISVNDVMYHYYETPDFSILP